MRTRSNVYTLIHNEKTDWPAALVSYRKGVAAMRAKDPTGSQPPTDRLSWQYLAAVHGRPNKAGEEDYSDPLWTQCQHGSWFFFPWHRMYLLTLESFIQHFSADSQWSVPYWYAVDPDDLTTDVLPQAFRDSSGDNALYVKERSTRALGGQPIFEAELVAVFASTFVNNLALRAFSFAPALKRPSYGGAEFKDHNFNWRHNGAIESIPHAPVHNFVGTDYGPDHKTPTGPVGFMSDLLTAARDPIFWLHHCNIDRLWQMWLDLDPAHKNPGADEWLNSSFEFPTPDPKKTKTWQVGDVLDTTAPGLGYVYDTAAAPSAVAPVVSGFRPREVGPEVSAPTPAQPPQLIGATVDVPIVAERSADIALSPPAMAARAVREGRKRAEPQEWLLSMEGITGTVAAPVYSVYLNLPAGAVPAEHPELLAGMITTFGLPQASRPGGDHDGMGLSFVFDITGVHDTLQAAGNWDPSTISVTFVPLAPPPPDDPGFAERLAAAPEAPPDLRAARIAVLVA
jgi:tyrosinase